MPERQRSSEWTHTLIAGAGLTASTAVVAMAARAPLTSTTRVSAASAHTPIAAVVILLLGCGVVALGGLIMVTWPGRRRRSDEEPVSEPPQLHWAWKLAALLFTFALGMALVAAVGARRTVRRSARQRRRTDRRGRPFPRQQARRASRSRPGCPG
jgi:hypothetical protein